MRSAFASFEKQGMPSPAEEAWKYVDLDVELHGMELASGGSVPGPDPFVLAAPEAAIVDGLVASVGGRATVLDEEALTATLERVSPDTDVFAAARGAFAREGIRVDVPAGTVVEEPIVLDVVAASPGASFPVVFISAGPNSEAAVVVVLRSADVAAVTAPLIVADVADGARLRLQSVQNLSEVARGVTHLRVTTARDASALLGEVGLGGRFGRLDLAVSLTGAGSSASVAGLYFGEGEQVLDYRLLIDHVAPSTSSDVFLKGAVEDNARSVFSGLLRIGRDAARASAFETNRNLVLSEGAKAHSVPNLEILCNDVVCGHGSTVGPLDSEQLYYLESRGLRRDRAERLLVRGFFQEAIDRLPVAGLEGPVSDAVYRRFVDAQSAGRVG